MFNISHQGLFKLKSQWDITRILYSGKESACQAGDARDADSITGLGRYPGVGNGNQLQYSCLENSMDRGAWWATVHGIAKNQTWLSDWACTHKLSPQELNADTSFGLISNYYPTWYTIYILWTWERAKIFTNFFTSLFFIISLEKQSLEKWNKSLCF